MSTCPTRPALALIAAVTENRVIGKNGAMPWSIPADLRYFKRITQGHTVIMGRGTWESIGRPLPNRRNIVVTSEGASAKYAGAEMASSLEQALSMCREEEDLVFCIGGGVLYQAAIPVADYLYLTEIQATLDGDTYFPEVDKSQWLTLYREPWSQEAAPTRFDFVLYARKAVCHDKTSD